MDTEETTTDVESIETPTTHSTRNAVIIATAVAGALTGVAYSVVKKIRARKLEITIVEPTEDSPEV